MKTLRVGLLPVALIIFIWGLQVVLLAGQAWLRYQKDVEHAALEDRIQDNRQAIQLLAKGRCE